MTVIGYVTRLLIFYAEVEITRRVASITKRPLWRWSSPQQHIQCLDKYVFLTGVSGLFSEAT